MYKYVDAQDNIITVPKGKCWRDSEGDYHSVNQMDDTQLETLGLSKYVTPPSTPVELTIEQRRAGMIVTPWQFRKALNATGQRDMVEAAVAQADQDTQDGWQIASSFERLNSMIVSFGEALGLSEEELDDLFTLAASL